MNDATRQRLLAPNRRRSRFAALSCLPLLAPACGAAEDHAPIGESDGQPAFTGDPFLDSRANKHWYVDLTFALDTDGIITGVPDLAYVSLDYGPCLVEFYEDHPEYRLDGSIGEHLFGKPEDGWYRPCDSSCAWVLDVQQSFGPKPSLALTFLGNNGLGSATFGPLPTPEIAGCEEPFVFATSETPIHGSDRDGGHPWTMRSVEPVGVFATFEGATQMHVTGVPSE